jgi:drug/metabolite transporter (DMT)-like permease
MWISLALPSFPPATLMAIRVLLAALVLLAIMFARRMRLPADRHSWRLFFIQSLVNSTGPWLMLAWAQQYTGSAISSVLNSTSPLWVFAFSFLLLRQGQRPGTRQLSGALLGFAGIVLIVGVGALEDIGQNLVPQLVVLAGAALYGIAALRGPLLAGRPPIETATGTLLCASVVLVPASLVLDQPWELTPDVTGIVAALMLAVACTAFAFLIYFRLLSTLGPMGTASQAYLRSGVGVFLGVVFLSESLTLETFAGICLAIFGVVLINWPQERKSRLASAAR